MFASRGTREACAAIEMLCAWFALCTVPDGITRVGNFATPAVRIGCGALGKIDLGILESPHLITNFAAAIATRMMTTIISSEDEPPLLSTGAPVTVGGPVTGACVAPTAPGEPIT